MCEKFSFQSILSILNYFIVWRNYVKLDFRLKITDKDILNKPSTASFWLIFNLIKQTIQFLKQIDINLIKQTIQYLQQIDMKNLHLISCAGNRIQDLLNISILP